MCILFIYTNPNPPKGGYRLIVASNRDEYYERPAIKAFFDKESNIIGGRDMEPGREGGMWLGLALQRFRIKFGALLNVTGEKRKRVTTGKGPLVSNYLRSTEEAWKYLENLQTQDFSAFNLILLEIENNDSICYHHSNAPEATLQYLGEQILGFGNSTPYRPFAKVENGKKMFGKIIAENQNKNQLIAKLIDLLKCQGPHLPDAELERRRPSSVCFLSSIFVCFADGRYGTRTHSVILVDDANNVEFVEHTMKEPINRTNPKWDVTVIKTGLVQVDQDKVEVVEYTKKDSKRYTNSRWSLKAQL